MGYLTWYGGKAYLADLIIGLIPEHHCYVEVFGGAGHVLFQKTPSPVEVYNDIHDGLVTLFRVLRNNPDELFSLLKLTPYSRSEYNLIANKWRTQQFENDIEKAYVVFYMIFATFNVKLFNPQFSRSPKSNKAKAYFNAVEKIYEISERLRNVIIESLDFRKCIEMYDGDDVVFYLDPPYLRDARRSKSKAYDFEMSYEDHIDLLKLLKNTKGKWILSGYHNELYDLELKDYPFVERDVFVCSQYTKEIKQGKSKERAVEVLWLNFDRYAQLSLFNHNFRR